MSGRNGNNNCCKNDTDGAAAAAANHAAAVKPDNNFIAGLKRLAKERRVANDAANKERVAADQSLDDNNRDQLGGKAVRSNNPAKDQNGAVANGKGGDANGTTGDNIPDMTGKVISVSTENQPLSSSSNNQPQSKQHRRRDDSNKQRQKKKNGTSGSHPKTKKKPTTLSQLEDGLLPDMTGKEILVDQLELPSIEPVKEEVDLDDLILEEQSSTSTNKRITVGATSPAAAVAATAGGTSKNLNRRGLLTRNRSISQRSLMSSSTTSENSNGGGGSRSQLFASYNDPSQRSLQTQTTSATSGKDSGGGDDSELLPQQQEQQELPQTITRNLSPANSRRDRVSSLHSSYQYAPTTLGRIPSGGILPDGVILPEVDEEIFQSKITDAISKSMPPSRSISPSWASLIALDEHSKRASKEMESVGEEEEERYYTSPSHRRKSVLQTSWTSVKSEGSKNSHGSRESDSRRSKRSTGDGGRSRRSNRSGSGSGSERRKASSENNWRNESTMSMLPTLSQMKDPEYIRSQAMERFERGLDYAEIGKLGAARERFLVALRYRVMDRGSLHPDVAATHEMLGHVEYFLGENKKNGSFEGNLVRLDEGDDGLLGGNLTIMENPDKDGQSSLSSRGKSHYEKAAMHYQTALDILDAKELDISNEKMSAWMNGGSAAKDETEFQWKELAETYTTLDEKGRLGVEERIDIVARIQERMDELPVTVGEKSYATSFLSTFYE